MINANTLTGIINKDDLKLILMGNELGINDLTILKKMLEEEIESNSNRYTYCAYIYPKIAVYASAVFSSSNLNILDKKEESNLENVYIHILPLQNKTLILIGFHNDYVSDNTKKYCKSWKDLSRQELELKLTKLFSTNIENWGLSPNLFNEITNKNKSKYIKLFKQNISYYDISDDLNFNLFDIT